MLWFQDFYSRSSVIGCFVGYFDTKLVFIRTILTDVTVMKGPKKFLRELNHLNLRKIYVCKSCATCEMVFHGLLNY